MFDKLESINRRPKPFEFYTTPELWNDDYISERMLEYHLAEDVDLASRNKAFIDRSVGWIKSHFNIGRGTKICDFGCGPGLYTTPLALAGADVTGIDLSRRSIEYARKTAAANNIDIEYINQNYLDYSSDKKFDLITMIFCDFCVLNPDQRQILLGKFNNNLAKDGALLFDVSSLNSFNATEEQQAYEYSPGNGFWSHRPYFVFNNTFKYDSDKLILNKFTIVEKNRIRESYNWLQCHSLESLERELRSCGLEIDAYYTNVAGDDYRDDSSEIAVVVRSL
jgi:SAM-dependent methyltransferase